jgi:hypothetical protein
MHPPDPNLRNLTLLGPQPEYESLRGALNRMGLNGRLALITAGWEEAENEDEPLVHLIPNEIVNLRLFRRSELLFAQDPLVIQMLQKRQDVLRHLRDVYRMRVSYFMRATNKILGASRELVDFQPELDSSLNMLRQLDREYFLRTCQVCDDYDAEIDFDHRPSVVSQREELSEILGGVSAILIAGGHSAIIMNRLKIFSILEMRPDLPIIAWSGGAMALASQMVFFHDRLPQGDSNPEILRAGAGIIGRVLPFPDPANRLRLDDTLRMSVLARRFSDSSCVLLDSSDWVERRNGKWTAAHETRQLATNGRTEAFSA